MHKSKGMHRFKKILMVAVFLGLIGVGWQQGHGQPKGPMITLEEEEITLFDENGKELRKLSLSSNGKEKRLILSAIRAKVLQKMGFHSFDEIKKENRLLREYHRQYYKLFKTETLKLQQVKFTNSNGNTIKQIKLGEKKESTKIKDISKNREWNGYKVTIKNATLSENQKYCLLAEHNIEVQHNIDDQEESADYVKAYGEGAFAPPPQQTTLSLFDDTGKEVSQTNIEQSNSIAGGPQPHMIVSDSGVFAFVTSSDEGPGDERLYVYQKDGKLLLTFPEKDVRAFVEGPISITPNGRFLAAKVRYLDEGLRLLAFDLLTGKQWKADKGYTVLELGDDGKMEVSFGNEENTIDLSKSFNK